MSFCCELDRAERAAEKERESMNVKPLQDKLLIRQDKQEEQKGGIFIPDIAKEPPIMGTVVAAGEGKILENGKVRKMEVKEGDRVLFSKYAGTDMKFDGEDLVMMTEDDILGVIEKD